MISSSIKKPSVIKDGFLTLQRKTRSDIPYFGNRVYTRDAFEKAIKKYAANDGSVYLAPVCIDDESGYDDETICYINNNVYRAFHNPKISREYSIGRVYDWDDYTITIKYEPTKTAEILSQYITTETKVNLRYIPYNYDYTKGIPISDMTISLVDLGVIPFEVIDLDINELLSNMKRAT